MSANASWWVTAASIYLSVFSPTNIFSPAATPAHSIYKLSLLVFGVIGGIFFVVGGLLLYALLKYRHRPTDAHADREPPQIYGSNQIELSWTVIPILIVVMLFLATARVIFVNEHARKPFDAVNVTVIGHQFWWEYHYPGLGVVTANELHIPVSLSSHPTPSYLTMSSADMDHSFWVPRLAGKRDLIPNKINVLWLDPEAAGLYLGQCAGYCGTQHAKMLIRVYADTPKQFAAWIAQQQQPARQDPAAAEGRAVFERNACISCHAIRGTVADGRFAPDLTHFGSRDTLASGAVVNNPANLRSWIDNPAHFKPGALMPPMHLNAHELDAVTLYLTTLK